MVKGRIATLLLWGAVILLLLMIIGVQAWERRHQQGIVRLDSEPCDLNQESCHATLGETLSLTTSISPRPISVLSPLQVLVEYHGPALRSARIQFNGIGMDMGVNSFPLHQTTLNNGLSGEVLLPVCIQQQMEWEAQLWLDTAAGQRLATFRFTTLTP